MPGSVRAACPRSFSTELAALALSLLLSGCAAAVGPQITSQEEKEAQAALRLEAKAWQKTQQQRIDDLGTRLMKATGNQNPLRFHFVASPDQTDGEIHPDSVNAWTDGQSVWVTRGMMRFVRNDDELAVVLAHEMAHAYRGHMNYLRAKQILGMALGITAEILAGPGAGRLARIITNAATKKFDRDQEREADLYGLIWAFNAGFSADAAKEIWKRMAVEMPESMEGGFLSSHPGSAERLLAMGKVAETLKKGVDPLEVFAPKDR